MTEPPYQPGQSITNGILYRRIPPLPGYFDHLEGRPTSQAFRKKSKQAHLSMALQELTTVEGYLSGHPGYGLCEVDVPEILGLGLRVDFHPEPGEPAHVAVFDVSRGIGEKLARRARVIRSPDPP